MTTNLSKERVLTPSQKMMIFVLSMATFGVADLLTEIIPSFSFGPIDISIAYFAFIPLTLAILFDPLSAAVGAAFGEMVFSDLLLGDFSGIGELEGFLQLSIAMFIAGYIVRNPLNKGQLAIASLVGVGIDKILGGIVDILKVVIGVEEFEAVPGLPESVFALEGVAILTDLIITGVIFGVIPTLYLVPKLYGKIEPLLGMKPRTKRPSMQLGKLFTPKLTFAMIFFAILAGGLEILSEMDINFGAFEPDYLDKFGDQFLYYVIAGGMVLIGLIIIFIRKAAKENNPGTKSA